MATIWIKSPAATFSGPRCVVSSIPEASAEKVAREFQAEFADMGLDITVWVEG